MTMRPEPDAMTAMVLEDAGPRLEKRALPRPEPGPGQLLIRVAACAVCRTDLHIVDGDLPDAGRPRVPGHEVIGRVVSCGAGVSGFAAGDRVGVPWLGFACGHCDYCRAGQENLCAGARFTGYHMDGGFAEHMLADARFCFAIPDVFDDQAAAPLMCAGLIGYRALRMAGDIPGEARRIGLYGFGAAAHIITQVALFQGRQIYAFTRPGDSASQAFARELGACWAGSSDQKPPDELDAAILFAPVGALVPAALAAIRRAGVVVCAGIHMSDIPRFAYHLLWGERMVRSVANLTRRDGEEFLALAARAGVRTTTHRYDLEQANQALDDLRAGRFEGAAVLVP
jgi:propanol-preferring alcohol dehydrogenase